MSVVASSFVLVKEVMFVNVSVSAAEGCKSAEVRRLQSDADRVLTGVFAEFTSASPRERQRMLEAVSDYSLQHQAHLAEFARVLETAPSELSTAAKDLHYPSTGVLLQHELGYGKSAADVLTRLGKLLESREYPVLAAAVESGTVSNQQAGVIVRKLDSWRKKQDAEFLLLADKSAVEFAEGSEDARAWKPESLEKAIRAWYYEQHPEEAELTTAEQWEQRKCFGRMLQDGRVKIDAVIPADEGAAVLQFLDANASPKARFGAPNGDPDQDQRTRTQKMADAFMLAFTTAAKTKETSTQGGAAPTLLVTVPIREIHNYAAGTPAVARVSRTQELVPVAEAAKIICDGAVQVAITDNLGNVMNLGRTQRLFTPTQRRALNATYPECATTGCDIPAVWCEVDLP